MAVLDKNLLKWLKLLEIAGMTLNGWTWLVINVNGLHGSGAVNGCKWL